MFDKFNPISLKPVMWFDSDCGLESSAGVPAVNGGVVGRWLDKGGSGYHATNVTAGNQPIYAGPRSGISGDGVNDSLNVAGVGQPIYEVFSVQKNAAATFNSYWFPIANSNFVPRIGCFQAATSHLYADTVPNDIIRKNGARLDTVTSITASLAPLTGDFLLDVVASNPIAPTRMYSLLAMENVNFGNANLKEVMAFNRVLTSSERNQLNAYFGSKYDLKIDTSPENIPGLFLWLNADSIEAADGAKVSSWNDYGPNGYHFSQSTPDNQPTLKKNSINGHATLRFNGTNNFLFRPRITPGTAVTSFIITRPRITSEESLTYPCVYTDVNLRVFSRLTVSGWGMYTSNGADFSANESLERYTPALLRITTSPSGSTLARNGVLKNAVSASSVGNPSASSSIGSDFGEGRYFKGDIAEIINFNRILSAVEIEQVEKYLTAKYNIGMALPSNIANARLWVDAENLALPNLTPVSSWTDRAVGSSVTQASAPNRPVYTTNAINDKPALNFNGTSSYFNTNVTGPGANFTIFWAAKGPVYTSLVRYQKFNGFIVFPWVNSKVIDVNNGNTTDGLEYPFANVPTIACYYSEPNKSTGRGLRVNGQVIAEKSTGSGLVNDELTIGMLYNSGAPAEFTSALVGDILIYSRRLAPYEIQYVEEYLRCKYNT